MQKMPIGAPSERRRSYAPSLIVFCLYSIAFTMVFPALPSLLLSLTKQDSARASELYGMATALKFFMEFFSSPVLGTLSDRVGRRSILLLSLATIGSEYFLLSAFPSMEMIFITRGLSGLGDATVAITYATISDIATANDDFVTKEFGRIGASFGIGVVIGPLLGSYLCKTSLSLCFLTGCGIIFFAFIVSFIFIPETAPFHLIGGGSANSQDNAVGYQIASSLSRPIDPFSIPPKSSSSSENSSFFSKINPFYPIRAFFSSGELRVLSYPFMLSHMSSGIHYVWVLYLKERFDATYMDVGLFMAVSGIVVALTQGCLIKAIIPGRLSEESATVICLFLSCLQLFCFGLCPSLFSFYVVVLLFAPASIYGPAIKALLSNAAGAAKQGELQGALGGLKTISAGFGALLFSWVYSFSSGALATAAYAHASSLTTTISTDPLTSGLSLSGLPDESPETSTQAANAISAATTLAKAVTKMVGKKAQLGRSSPTLQSLFNSSAIITPDMDSFSPLSKMMSFSSDIMSSSLSKDSSYYDYAVFALEEGFPFFVAAWLYFIAFLFMLYYVRNLSAYKGSTLSQHSLTRGKNGLVIEGNGAGSTTVRPKMRSQFDEDNDDENQFFYKI